MTTVDDDFDQFEDTAPAPAKRAPRTAAKKTTGRTAPAKKAPARKASSRIPSTAKRPQDRKAPAQSGHNARRREADGVEIVDIPVVTSAGAEMVVTIPLHQGDWSVRTVYAFAHNRQLDAIEGLFGPEQWEAFLALEPTMNDLGVVGEHVAKELGMDTAGN